MARKYKVTLKGCLTYTVGPYEFEKDRPKDVTNEADVKYFRSRPEFRVQQIDDGTPAKPVPQPAAQPVLEQDMYDPEAESSDDDAGDAEPEVEQKPVPPPLKRGPGRPSKTT